ncbi:hypothetical protein JCM16106_10510 [Hydrogenophilus islandicus]
MLTDFFVRDFVRRDPLVFTPETPLAEALEAFVTHRVNGAPVVDRFGQLIGFFSEKDLLKPLIADAYLNELAGSVGDSMSHKVVTLDANDTLLDAARAFTEHHYHTFPVLENGVLIGVLDRARLIATLAKILHTV